MKKFSITTFGCQMNVHDSEKIAGVLASEGMTPSDNKEDADLIVFNTCSVRQKADQKFFSMLGRMKALKKQNPNLKIAVMGCIAQQMGAGVFKRASHVDFVIGPQNIKDLRNIINSDQGRAVMTLENPGLQTEELPATRAEKGSAWVNIMYGCDNFCTYCIVPYTRGRERSRPSESIIREIEGLARDGVREVTLLGQNVNSYRSDTDFPGLLKLANRIGGIERIRFVTSHPRDLSENLISAMASLPKVCGSIHLPLQSGSDRILGLMNRRYTYNEYLGKVRALRTAIPDIAITTDIIAGFPTETPEDHQATVRALTEIEYDGIFAFKYSIRPGTKAAKMDGDLPDGLKLERLIELLSLQDGISLRKNRVFEGLELEILIEGLSETDPSRLAGKTKTNKTVNFEPPNGLEIDFLTGKFAIALIKSAMKHSFEAEIRPETLR